MQALPSALGLMEAPPEQVQELLSTPESSELSRYFAKLLENDVLVELRLNAGDGKGKGLFVTQDVEQGTVLFEERPLVAGQHMVNKRDCLCCGHCFQFVGSVEQQIAHKLLKLVIQLQDDSCGSDLMKRAGKINRVVGPQGAHLRALKEQLVTLPHSANTPLPPMVRCRGGCGALYCSEDCLEAAWQQYHCLLCPGGPAALDLIWKLVFSALGCPQDHHDEGAASGSTPAACLLEPSWLRVDRAALRMFQDHADETNDIFEVAATVIAKTLVQAHKLLQEEPKDAGGEHSQDQCWQALLSASLPWRAGWKRLWWEGVAVPDDVADELQFRQQMQEIAAASLELLRSAIFDPRFPALFSLEVFGGLVGMFELNNLDLDIASPVGDYFCMLDELPAAEQRTARQYSQLLMDALGPDCDTPLEGTAFMSRQSCINHSCAPNCSANWGAEAVASMVATRDIAAGEQLEITYIDEELSTAERQAALRDYGFVCLCPRCSAAADGA